MKHRYSALLLLTMTSCAPHLEEQAFQKLRPSLKVPDSYRLISIEPIDTLTEYGNIDARIKEHERMQSEALELIDEYLRVAKENDYKGQELRKVDELFLEYQLDSAMIDFLLPKLEKANTEYIEAIRYTYRFRCENDNGVISPNMYYLWATEDGDVIEIANALQDLSTSPTEIEGYDEKFDETYKEYKQKKKELK